MNLSQLSKRIEELTDLDRRLDVITLKDNTLWNEEEYNIWNNNEHRFVIKGKLKILKEWKESLEKDIKELINWRNEQTGYREDSTLDKIKEIFGKELTE